MTSRQPIDHQEIQVPYKIVIAAFALSVSLCSLADTQTDIDMATASKAQIEKVERTTATLETVDTDDENMTHFLNVVRLASSETGDVSLSTAGRNHLRHLSLGYAHGKTNVKTHLSNAIPDAEDNTNNIGSYIYGTDSTNVAPHNDACNGNGHTGNVSSASSNNLNAGSGVGFGLTDCGNPSPSD